MSAENPVNRKFRERDYPVPLSYDLQRRLYVIIATKAIITEDERMGDLSGKLGRDMFGSRESVSLSLNDEVEIIRELRSSIRTPDEIFTNASLAVQLSQAFDQALKPKNSLLPKNLQPEDVSSLQVRPLTPYRVGPIDRARSYLSRRGK